MTELEAVDALKAFGAKEQELFQDYNADDVMGYHKFPGYSFIVGLKDNLVTYFYCGSVRVSPPEEIISTFRHLQKVVIQAEADYSLEWLKCLPSVVSLEIIHWNGQVLPVEWSGAGSVERLYIQTETGKIPAIVRSMRNLRQLGVDSVQPLELPDWLSMLKGLEKVYLRKNTLKSIPEPLWKKWKKDGLPVLLHEQAVDRGVFLEDAKLENNLENKSVRLEWYQRTGDDRVDAENAEKLKEHYNKIRTQKFGTEELLSECMVIFLGDGAVGKSSLIDRLMNRNLPFEVGKSAPTSGVRMLTWPTKFGVEGEKETDETPLSLRLMDFGGQEIMHSIHRCFMTKNTVYVVVCESRMDSEIDANAVRWLETVKTFAPGSSVILALNKVDANENVSVNEKDLKERYPGLKYILRTTALTDSYYAKRYPLSKLEGYIKKLARECNNTASVGSDWIAIKRELENLRDEETQEPLNYITENHYMEICRRHNVTDPVDQRDMLNWFRDLAVVYSYEDNANGDIDLGLKGVRVLRPQWLSNGIYRIILRAPENDLLSLDDIRETLRHTQFGDSLMETVYDVKTQEVKVKGKKKPVKVEFDEPDFILHVMRKFSLSHRADDHEGQKEMIPSRLTKNPPDKADSFPMDKALHLRWEGRYLPNNVIHSLMIKRYSQLQRDCMWRTGAVFLCNENGDPANWENYDYQALVKMNDEGLDLYVVAAPDMDPRVYLRRMRTDILDIMSDMNLTPEEYPCYRKPGTDSREVKASYSLLMHDICTSTAPDEVVLTAQYTARRETGRQNMTPGEKVSAIQVLETLYTDSEVLIEDYRRKTNQAAGQAQADAEAEQPHKNVGHFRQTWQRLTRKVMPLLYASNALSNSRVLPLTLFLVILFVLRVIWIIASLPA